MYTQHFGLNAEPFGLTPDPAFLFPSSQHQEALAALQIGLQGRRGLMVMVGEVGTGKTTLLYSLLPNVGAEVRLAYISNTKLSFEQMLAQALADFGVAAGADGVNPLRRFTEFVLRCADENAVAAIVIDEAQNLEDECLENLRLLSNVETFDQKLLQIILVGQPELNERLSRTRLRQLRERVAVYSEVKPLSYRESYAYVAHRLACAGGGADIFTPAALAWLLWKAGGIPRRINILLHNAMLFAYGRDVRRVSWREARSAVRARLQPRRLPRLRRLRVPAPPEATTPDKGSAQRFTWTRLSTLPVLVCMLALAVWRAGDSSERASAAPEPPQPVVAAAPALASIGSIASAPHKGVPRSAPYPRAHKPQATEQEPAAPITPIDPTAAKTEAKIETGPDQSHPRPRIVRVEPGANLTHLTRAAYGRVDANLIAFVRSVNPSIEDPDRIGVGDLLIFPAVETAGRPEE
jgi:general secretion pathway protein A